MEVVKPSHMSRGRFPEYRGGTMSLEEGKTGVSVESGRATYDEEEFVQRVEVNVGIDAKGNKRKISDSFRYIS